MRIYDCITFFNEFEILELRLQELFDVVDIFVIVEANKTHTGHEKPFNFEDNIHRFEKWKSKIRYVKVYDLPDYHETKKPSLVNWVPENFQRNCIARGLHDAQPGDLVFVSDCDEIWDKDTAKKYLNSDRWVCFEQHLFIFYMNTLQPKRWPGSIMARYGTFSSPQELRNQRCNSTIVKNGGWHYSYQGGPKRVEVKVQNIAEACQTPPTLASSDSIEDTMKTLKDPWGRRDIVVTIDESYIPKAYHEFINKYPDFRYTEKR